MYPLLCGDIFVRIAVVDAFCQLATGKNSLIPFIIKDSATLPARTVSAAESGCGPVLFVAAPNGCGFDFGFVFTNC